MKNKKDVKLEDLQVIKISTATKTKLFKNNLREYLNSKATGGLYGLTIDGDGFIEGLIKAINLGLKNKQYKRPKDKMKSLEGGIGRINAIKPVCVVCKTEPAAIKGRCPTCHYDCP